ncbi:hypothetical protein ACH5RR_028924 [Cinchona calisaya]|uniref:Uncharacterized protein n=1 Tax=Cinchona calisaya TaxID=153742 RepID=A0ABD2YVF7_9GENT
MLRNIKVQLLNNVQETEEIKTKFQKCDLKTRKAANCVRNSEPFEHAESNALNKPAEDANRNKLKKSEASLRTVIKVNGAETKCIMDIEHEVELTAEQ